MSVREYVLSLRFQFERHLWVRRRGPPATRFPRGNDDRCGRDDLYYRTEKDDLVFVRCGLDTRGDVARTGGSGRSWALRMERDAIEHASDRQPHRGRMDVAPRRRYPAGQSSRVHEALSQAARPH
ncbi:hypothetical protein R1flu_020722 [Riccia fluitans]|uniref:Uncharacterized protein n=1 Tax=Riccia fluitans TaxID=41844 RepID=A0ABD1ZR07_9MARC